MKRKRKKKNKNHKSETCLRNKTALYEILNVGHELLIIYNRRYVRLYLVQREITKSRVSIVPRDFDRYANRVRRLRFANVFAPSDTSRFDRVRNFSRRRRSSMEMVSQASGRRGSPQFFHDFPWLFTRVVRKE